ncbi:MAG: TIGR00282 family metallophosphoesterase [bacterium]|nr:TIGR00282 family metallophosphoesterase [bacterium]
MKVLVIGDVVGRTGREVVSKVLHRIRQEKEIDFVIANSENAAGGFGLTPKIANQLFDLEIDLLTTGNHIWNRKEIYNIIDEEERILRPLNYPPGVPGRGSVIVEVKDGTLLGVINLAGRVFVQELDCPFRAVKQELKKIKKKTRNILVDIHGEATSEKVALGWFLDGEVSAVIGTHTHVQTSDERILPEGTAYITDVGMTGPRNSVIGIKKDIIIKRFLTQIPIRLDVAKDKGQFQGVVVEIDTTTGCAKGVERIKLDLE